MIAVPLYDRQKTHLRGDTGKKDARFAETFSQRQCAADSFWVHGYARAYSVPQVDRRLLYALICRRCFWWGIFTARLSRRGRCRQSAAALFSRVSPFALFSLIPSLSVTEARFSLASKSNDSGSLFPRQKPQPKFEINNAPACPNRIPQSQSRYTRLTIVLQRW